MSAFCAAEVPPLLLPVAALPVAAAPPREEDVGLGVVPPRPAIGPDERVACVAEGEMLGRVVLELVVVVPPKPAMAPPPYSLMLTTT